MLSSKLKSSIISNNHRIWFFTAVLRTLSADITYLILQSFYILTSLMRWQKRDSINNSALCLRVIMEISHWFWVSLPPLMSFPKKLLRHFHPYTLKLNTTYHLNVNSSTSYFSCISSLGNHSFFLALSRSWKIIISCIELTSLSSSSTVYVPSRQSHLAHCTMYIFFLSQVSQQFFFSKWKSTSLFWPAAMNQHVVVVVDVTDLCLHIFIYIAPYRYSALSHALRDSYIPHTCITA